MSKETELDTVRAMARANNAGEFDNIVAAVTPVIKDLPLAAQARMRLIYRQIKAIHEEEIT